MQSKIIWRAFMFVAACAPVFVSSSPVPLRAGAESYSLVRVDFARILVEDVDVSFRILSRAVIKLR
ncbi:hypothetical protein ARMGADRAFT_1070192 [Armillaria gallica]|uniref:Uncharacterized protein n=1 Tax=Armillaria gallica TaxID=47427 RepID=A0A2H3ETC9_ARMGA|nr:hypothetical protein ARMGADRAFT_1070192 [Armillaria gallica]